MKRSTSFYLLLFLGIFGFSIGLFDNYRELWMSANQLSTESISNVISISYLVTVLVLCFFMIKVSVEKLKIGILVSLFFKFLTSTFLLILNQSENLFWIKFIMFFDISFTQLIVSSIYPLLMNIEKSDVLYARKNVIESLSNKFGFLFVAILLGKTVFSYTISYNTCLLFSIFFVLCSFFIFLNIPFKRSGKSTSFNLFESFTFFKTNKVFLFYLFINLLNYVVWASILGMPLLTLTMNFSFTSNFASFLILGLGILSNILSLILVKYFQSKSDDIHLFFKFGFRVCLYFLVFLTGNYYLFFFTLLYLFLTDCTHSFLFDSFFVNQIPNQYSLLFTILKYCTSLIGVAIGTYFCGNVFHGSLRQLVFFPLIFGILQYFCLNLLLKKKKEIQRRLNM